MMSLRSFFRLMFLSLFLVVSLTRGQQQEGRSPRPDGYCFYRALTLRKDEHEPNDVKDAYDRLIQDYPQTSWGENLAIHKKIQEAYEILSHSESKNIYDMYGMKGFEAWERGEDFSGYEVKSFKKKGKTIDNNAKLAVVVNKLRDSRLFSEEQLDDLIEHVNEGTKGLDKKDIATRKLLKEWMKENKPTSPTEKDNLLDGEASSEMLAYLKNNGLLSKENDMHSEEYRKAVMEAMMSFLVLKFGDDITEKEARLVMAQVLAELTNEFGNAQKLKNKIENAQNATWDVKIMGENDRDDALVDDAEDNKPDTDQEL